MAITLPRASPGSQGAGIPRRARGRLKLPDAGDVPAATDWPARHGGRMEDRRRPGFGPVHGRKVCKGGAQPQPRGRDVLGRGSGPGVDPGGVLPKIPFRA